MVFSKEDRILNKMLRQVKGYNAHRFLKEFSNKDWGRRALERLIARIDMTGVADENKKPGRPRTVRIDENINAVAELVLTAQPRRRSRHPQDRETGCERRRHFSQISETHYPC